MSGPLRQYRGADTQAKAVVTFLSILVEVKLLVIR